GGDAPGVPVTGHEYALFELSRRVTRFTCPRCGTQRAVDAGICLSCSATSSAADVSRLHATCSRFARDGTSSSLRSKLVVAAVGGVPSLTAAIGALPAHSDPPGQADAPATDEPPIAAHTAT